MAAIPLIACDPVNSWYDFPYPLSWSDDCEVAEVLSDIPFISVGILVFCVSTLFLVMKRVSISAIWLYFSALQAFIASVLDLGQTLADGMAMNTTFAVSKYAIRTREVLFALSIGFRFLFYWSYVAEPPRKDLSAVSVQKTNFFVVEQTYELHSGSWTRWGLPGKLLGVGLLVAIITITALQVVWRVAPQFHQYSSIYGTGAALELLVSFLLLLRLLSNTLTLNLPDNMPVHTFRECLAPISGLLVNIAVGVGDLLCFAFTESTVGRLLQAFEIYIIVVFVVVTTFFRYRAILLFTTSSQDRKHRDMAFTLPEPTRESTFRLTLPLIETPRMSTILGSAIQNKESNREVFHSSARRSLNHVSSWVTSRVPRNRVSHEDEEVRLWNAGEVTADPPYTEDVVAELVPDSMPPMQGPNELTEIPRNASTNQSVVFALDSQSAIVRSMEGSVHNGQISHPSRVDALQRATPSPIFSGAKCAGGVATSPEASPVYGLSGIQPHASASDTRTPFDELLRQQSQLDQSIEALKLFSARTFPNSDSTTSPRSAELTRSPSTGQRTVSSEVSLSSFPVPPWLTTPVPPLPPSRPSPVKRIRGNRQARFVPVRLTPVQDTHDPTTFASLVDTPSPLRFNSVPHSPFGEENESLLVEARESSCSSSGGTQYNVTSFIGGLATPGEPRIGYQKNSQRPIESEFSAMEIQSNPSVKKLPPCILPVAQRLKGLPTSPITAKHSPLACSSRLSQEDAANEPANPVQCQTSRAVLVTNSPRTSLRSHAEKCMTIPSIEPQVVRETASPIIVPAEGVDRVQRMFVRPRPPPLIIQPYTEQNPGIPRVQVLADD